MNKKDDELFFAALEYDTPEQREQWLKLQCGSDSKQFSRVLKLVHTHFGLQQLDSAKPSLLDHADLVFQAFSSSPALSLGDVVGGIYELKELIGEGGVGVVYRAQQRAPFERELAVKLLKPGMDSQRILARFAIERQALEQLDHVGITRVFDAGFQENGRPYFAMELVRNARTITAYCQECNLELRKRVQLMIAVCQTVQYAHQRGIIHRDLKPSNILLEGNNQTQPTPKVIDFGIAKFLTDNDKDSRGFTNLGERFGTPAYMSPEQALSVSGDVDIRTDVYSLGVVLFELLTGTTPRSIRAGDTSHAEWTSKDHWTQSPPLPSVRLRELASPTLARQDVQASHILPSEVKGELDWIVAKALSHDRDQRYQTVADLQKDLERFLVGEPVEAAGPSFVYRGKKFIERNRVAVAAACLTLFAIVCASLVSISLAVRAVTAERVASSRLDEVLKMQAELTDQRDAANTAARKAESLLRIFQIQTATGLALNAYFQEIFKTIGDPATANPAQIAQLTTDLDSQRLVKPHERLIIRGDWEWAADPFPDEIILGSLKITSKQAAAFVAPPADAAQPNTAGSADDSRIQSNPANIATSSTANLTRGSKIQSSFQDMLLNELRKVVGKQDPFIAEVLDNRGLNALEQGDFSLADACFSESSAIWSQTPDHHANVVQSWLFLAEVRLKTGATEQAKSVLNDVAVLMEQIPTNDVSLAPLREFQVRLANWGP